LVEVLLIIYLLPSCFIGVAKWFINVSLRVNKEKRQVKMSRSLIPAQHKLAEKLTILNHRGIGMLTRIYNIKKVQQNTRHNADAMCACDMA